MVKGSAKGFGWERAQSKKLSLWWTNNKNSDVFWRVRASGSRATNRKTRGERTINQYGDIMVTDPIGMPLVKYFTLELKRGYNKGLDFLKPIDGTGIKPSCIEKFMIQVYAAAENANNEPLLLLKRDYLNTVIGLTVKAYKSLIHKADFTYIFLKIKDYEMYFLDFDLFLNRVKPKDIIKLSNKKEK